MVSQIGYPDTMTMLAMTVVLLAKTQFVQNFFQAYRICYWLPSRPKLFLMVSGVFWLICLALAGPAPAAEHSFDGIYTGKRLLTKGSAPACPAEEDVSATIHGERLTFTTSELQKVGMGFHPRQDGSFGQLYEDIGGAYVIIRGRIVGDVLDADVTQNPCAYHWHLKKRSRG
jgi:hypothetical protein